MDELKIEEVEISDVWQEPIQTGVTFVPRSVHGKPVLEADVGDFAKWLRQSNPDLAVSLPDETGRLDQRSNELWLPLMLLASDTSVSVMLGIVANYLYDRAKGLLASDKQKIHLSLVYEDEVAGKTKKLTYSGDPEGLAKVMKKFDANRFLDD
jgi:hypothetical protein